MNNLQNLSIFYDFTLIKENEHAIRFNIYSKCKEPTILSYLSHRCPGIIHRILKGFFETRWINKNGYDFYFGLCLKIMKRDD